MVVTNLRVMKRTNRLPEEGDVFAMLPPDEAYLFGRVILADAPMGEAPMPGSHLIYVYAHRSMDTTVDWDELTPDRLLIPPVWINRMPWTKGYFVNVGSRPLEKGDLLEQHCFHDPGYKAYVDERGVRIRERVEPCGDFVLISYRWLDDLVSGALGIPLVPEDDD